MIQGGWCMVLGGLLGAAVSDVLPAQVSCARPSFRECHARLDSIELRQDERALIVQIGAVALGPRGHIAVSDISEANVKIYGDGGRLVAVLGRKGSGPGEFQEPIRLDFDASGRLLVLDNVLRRLTIFDPSFRFSKTLRLQYPGYVTSLQALPAGGTLLGVVAGGGVGVLRLDSLGRVRDTLLAPPRGMRMGSEPWRVLNQVSATIQGDAVLIVSAVQDSLFRHDQRSRRISAVQVPAAELRRVPDPPARFDPKAFAIWANSFFRPNGVYPSHGGVIVTLQKGLTFEGPVTHIWAFHPTGGWSEFRDSPPVVDVRDGVLVTMLDAGPERIAIGLFRRR